MRWLFVIGVSLDVSGAVLIALAPALRTRAKSREAAQPVLGGNFWSVLFQEQERTFVRNGLLLLVTGFALQLVAYVLAFEGTTTGMAGLVSAITLALAIGAGWWTASRRLPVRYHETIQLPDGIQDERHVYHVATLDEVLAFRQAWVSRMKGLNLTTREETVEPRIDHGRWMFECPRCPRGHAGMATPDIPTVACLDCGGVFPAAFPSHRERIESALMARQDNSLRNWKPGMSLELLKAENAQRDQPRHSQPPA